METGGDTEPTVVHIGTAAALVREAVTASEVFPGSDRVVAVGEDVTRISAEDATNTQLVVCDVPSAETVDRLDHVQAVHPDVPCLAVLSDESAIDEAIAAGATDVFVRRDGVDETALLARRIETVSTTPPREPAIGEPTERLIDTIDDAFYALDTEGNLVRWNDTFRDITGYDDSELAEMHALDFFTGADEERVAAAIEEVIETGSAFVEAEFRSKDGTTTPVEYTGALITDTDGSPNGVVGIGRDVTEREAREDQLVRLRQAVETITDSAPLTLFEVSPDGTVSTVRGETLTRHLDRSSIQGDAVRECFADQPELRRAILGTLNGNSNHDLVEIGSSTLETWLQPLLDETGSVSRVIGLALDVTEREERAKMLDQIQANAGEVIWMSTPGKQSMDFISDAYADVWGRSPEALYDDAISFVEAIHPDDRNRVEAALAQQREDPDAYDETYRVVHPDGEVRWVRDRSAGVYEDGELTRIVGIATDITLRKRREQELELKNRAIETAPVGIAIHAATESERPITYVNEQFEALTGYDRAAIENESITILAGDETDPDRIEAVETALQSGAHLSKTVILYRANGTPFWGRVHVAPVVGTDGDVAHVVSFLQDVTESKKHEQEIERNLEEFSEVLSEDLGLPLEEAKTRLETAMNSESQEDIQRAAQSVERARSLVEDLTAVHSFSPKSRRVSESLGEDPQTDTTHDN